MKHFHYGEFSCPHCGANEMDGDFLEMLDAVREEAGIPFVITSGFRCKEHNEAVGGKATSSHLRGLAADIACSTSGDRWKIVAAAIECGIPRIGIADTFIHLDMDTDKFWPCIWTY